MSQVNWEIFQAAVQVTTRYLPDPSQNPTQQEVAHALAERFPNIYRALEAVAAQIATENQQGLYQHQQQ